MVFFDLEGDNLYEDITTVWCGVFIDGDTEETIKFLPHQIDLMLSYMDTLPELCGHNVINFDFEVLKKLYDYTYTGTIIDTFILSQLAHADRPNGHSLEAWGSKLGYPKVQHDDWSRYTPDMLHRCATDVEITQKVYKALKSELLPVAQTGINWSESIELEHRIAQIIAEQEHTGVPFNTAKAIEYLELLSNLLVEVEQRVNSILGMTITQGSTIKTIFKKDGTYRAHIESYWDQDLLDSRSISGAYSKVEFKQITPGMYNAVKERYLQLGWIPSSYTDKGSPKLPKPDELEELANLLGSPELITIAEYGSIANRRNILRKWISIAERNGNRLPAGAFTCMANTSRMQHTTVVNVPRASSDDDGNLIWYPNKQHSFFGTEMRSLFYSGKDPNYVMVGTDAAGLELRCLAHYINKELFTDTILDGDIHTMWWEATGKHLVDSRSDQKNMSYAFLYGAGDNKLGTLCTSIPHANRTSKKGAEARSNLIKNVDGLEDLINGVVRASGRGYLRGLDGRKIHMRSSKGKVQTHKALNTLLQSTGSIIMKKFNAVVYDLIQEARLDVQQLINMHDEIEFLVHRDHTEKLKEYIDQAITVVEEHFKFNIRLDMDTQVGGTWAEVH